MLDSPTPVAGHNLGLSHAARLWPTPVATDAAGSRRIGVTPGSHTGVALTDAALGLGIGDAGRMDPALPKLWPTPTKSDGERGPDYAKAARGSGGDSLVTVAAAGPRPEEETGPQLWRTPTSTDWKGISAKSWRERGPGEGDPTPRLADQVDAREPDTAGALSPTWVEWLMGFPLGWTDPLVDDEDLEPWSWEVDPADVGRTSRLTTDRTLRKERVKALGNAVVPACAELIGRELMARWMGPSEG